MKIGILSDSHGKTRRLSAAIELLVDRGAEAIVHCGDIGHADDVAILARGKLCYRAAGDDIRHDDFRQEYATAVSEVQA